jgi:hypothetical protein
MPVRQSWPSYRFHAMKSNTSGKRVRAIRVAVTSLRVVLFAVMWRLVAQVSVDCVLAPNQSQTPENLSS